MSHPIINHVQTLEPEKLDSPKCTFTMQSTKHRWDCLKMGYCTIKYPKSSKISQLILLTEALDATFRTLPSLDRAFYTSIGPGTGQQLHDKLGNHVHHPPMFFQWISGYSPTLITKPNNPNIFSPPNPRSESKPRQATDPEPAFRPLPQQPSGFEMVRKVCSENTSVFILKE